MLNSIRPVLPGLPFNSEGAREAFGNVEWEMSERPDFKEAAEEYVEKYVPHQDNGPDEVQLAFEAGAQHGWKARDVEIAEIEAKAHRACDRAWQFEKDKMDLQFRFKRMEDEVRLRDAEVAELKRYLEDRHAEHHQHLEDKLRLKTALDVAEKALRGYDVDWPGTNTGDHARFALAKIREAKSK